ncbi:MAG: N-acetyl-gamma-glutamyl-phosphate reductase [Flavobacteriales bacterium]|nr:N-acetyl-gamma-glutamyl-phosphate reductase [Flavobacteriales bacterium]MCB9363370.1 N-acetyl-gamma-glutamyl-phosphate reductase [Flavobacteriales bacterium]
MKKVGIIGGSGYVAGELIRCLIHHPQLKIDFIYSHSQAGEKVSSIHDDLFTSELVLTDKVNLETDIIFLCLGHGHSKSFLEKYQFNEHTKIVDLSNDFRLQNDATFLGKSFTYGLVEFQKEKIKQSNYIANPGCFATTIQLALLPLAKAKLLNNEVHVNAITGATGAGKQTSSTSHFSWRNNNISTYKVFSHQHLGEIGETIESLQQKKTEVSFIPMRGDFTRGIFATVYTKCNWSEKKLIELFKSYYQDAVFTKVSTHKIHLKQVVNTNFCLLQIEKINDKVVITSVIDNLLKGAAGQAIQNANLMFGFDEQAGLNFKASYF